MSAQEWIAALLLAVVVPEDLRACIEARQARIAAAATRAAVARGVPVDLLLSVAYHEGHWGCARRSGGSWGAPLVRGAGLDGAAMAAAGALARGLARCQSADGAVASFRWGVCRAPVQHTGYGPLDVRAQRRRVAEELAR